jgi:His/Glu/Gln/Arg/opine family amino acid ABC transporter permease subunit
MRARCRRRTRADERTAAGSSQGTATAAGIAVMDYLDQSAVLLAGLFPKLVAGFLVTLGIAAAATPLALLFGLLLLAPRMDRRPIIYGPTIGFIELMRNTPLLVQIYLIYFGLPLLGFYPSEFVCGVAGIALQHGAFLVETYRGAIESISRRQWDAARAIGMGRLKAFRHVILPQAILKILGPLGNQVIVLAKDTSLVSAIGVMELTMTGKMAIERSAASAEIFVAIALFYLVLTTALGGVVRVIEHRVAGRY